jgi:hypothetical protein
LRVRAAPGALPLKSQSDDRRFIVQSDEKLGVFLELEAMTLQ